MTAVFTFLSEDQGFLRLGESKFTGVFVQFYFIFRQFSAENKKKTWAELITKQSRTVLVDGEQETEPE